MKRGLGWPIGVVVVLATVVGVNIWVAVIANRDPSFSIEPDYYAKAVQWDSTMAQARQNAALHWTLSSQLAPYSANDGATLRVRLTDSTGAVIRNARVGVSAFANARASSVFAATLNAGANDDYTATLPVHRAGEWELRFDVVRGQDHFTLTTRVDAIATNAP